MLVAILNILSAGAMAGVVTARTLGWLAPGDAFFAAVAILVLYTAYHLSLKDGLPLFKALRALMEPRSHGGHAGYALYLLASVLAAVVIAQAVLSA